MNKEIKAAEAARKEHLRKAGIFVKYEREAKEDWEKEAWHKVWLKEVNAAMEITKEINEMKGTD